MIKRRHMARRTVRPTASKIILMIIIFDLVVELNIRMIYNKKRPDSGN